MTDKVTAHTSPRSGPYGIRLAQTGPQPDVTGEPASTALPELVTRLARAADRHDSRRARKRSAVGGQVVDAGPVAAAWATAKLAVTAAGSPIVSAVMGALAASNTAAAKRLTLDYPAQVDGVLRGEPPPIPAGRVGRFDAGSRWFISSDLHRAPRGSADWPLAQNTKGLYEVALGHYGAEGWGLIENGDVEDFWLVGGSTYGVVYDAVRTFASALPRSARHQLRVHLYGEHLQRVVANNREIYDLIDELFHGRGRYVRLAGNHDDCYLDDSVVEHLRGVHDGIEMYDFVVLDGQSGPKAVVTHGHHTDSWNAPGRSGLGRWMTWLASAVVDAPLLSSNPGTPSPSETYALLGGTHPDRLTVVNPAFGFNRGLYTVDEVLLFEAFDRHFGDTGPKVLLGHTHLPVVNPSEPKPGTGSWKQYLNSGSGVHWELVTGIEWDGAADAAGDTGSGDPRARLVGWHFATDDTPREAIVAEHQGRPVARRWFEPAADGATLDVFPASR